MPVSWQTMKWYSFLIFVGTVLVVGNGIWNIIDLSDQKFMEDDNSLPWITIMSIDTVLGLALPSLCCFVAGVAGLIAAQRRNKNALIVFSISLLGYLLVSVAGVITVAALSGLEQVTWLYWAGLLASSAMVLSCIISASVLYKNGEVYEPVARVPGMAAYGTVVSPAMYGSPVPPAVYGTVVPPAAYGTVVPPATYGSGVSTNTPAYGSMVPVLVYTNVPGQVMYGQAGVQTTM